ncbi:MAG: bifunctional folylpolyglutamate synthase/ dihydrofolate synthase [Deltaproteobacteria bacterium]
MLTRYSKILQQLEDEANYERSARPRDLSKLEGVRFLLNQLGNPENSPKIVHIAGTNGKGSTALILAALLKQAGFKTGCYTSPHLIDLRERIQINGQCVGIQQFVEVAERILEISRNPQCPQISFFDLVTAIALEVFARAHCDWVVLETGLGGRADSTNVTPKELAILTRIGLDHQNILGNSILEIATEKLGIARKNVPLLVSPQTQVVKEWLKQQTRLHEIPTHWIEEKNCQLTNQAKQRLSAHKDAKITDVSRELALTALEILLPTKSRKQRQKRLELALELPLLGRKSRHFNIKLKNESTGHFFSALILDGAHNVDAVNSLIATLSEWQISCYGLLLGMAKDKMTAETRDSLQKLAQHAQQVGLVQYNSTRAADPVEILQYLELPRNSSILLNSSQNALRWASETTMMPWVITGSFHLLGEVLPLLSLDPCTKNLQNG